MKQLALILATAALLAGCSLTAPRPEQKFFVLDAGVAAPVAVQAQHPLTLLVAPTSAGSFYDTQEIVFARSGGTRSHYQFSNWTEAPSRRASGLLLARLDRAAAFKVIATTSSGVRGDLLLRTHIEEIFHDATQPPGVARVVLTAELSAPVKRTLVARRTFTAELPVARFDADGAVQALGLALGQVLDQVTAWAAAAKVD